jgi:hypothetical protein
MLARAQPTKNDGSHRRTNPEPGPPDSPLQPVAGRSGWAGHLAIEARHYDAPERDVRGWMSHAETLGVPIGRTDIGHDQMRSKSQAAWETAARCATLGQEADDPQERQHYARLRDAWITLAKRCEPFNFPDVTDSEKL